MKICIIGTGGFLSNSLIDAFANESFELLLIGRTKPGNLKESSFYKMDLVCDHLPFDLIQTCDVIFFTAAAGVQSSNPVNNEDVLTINSLIPIKLCENLKRLGYKGTFISFGSYFEIGNASETKPLTEDEVIQARAEVPNFYCFSKRILTQYFYNSKFNFCNYHFILPTIYGDGENPNRLIPYTIEGLKNNKPLSFTSGKQIRQYLWVGDAATLIINCMKNNIPSGIYNFPSAETLSVKELVDSIGKEFGVIVPEEWFNKVSRQDVSMPMLKINAAKLMGTIKIPNLRTIREYIRRTNLNDDSN